MAEVLIVLGIIGLVADMTIPTLISDVNEKVNKIAFKKAYSEINSAVNLILAEEGHIKGLCATDDNECFRDLTGTKMMFLKTCDENKTVEDGCWVQSAVVQGSNAGAILKNGTTLLFNAEYSDCGNIGSTLFCGFILIDANGLKKPNKFGKDIFGLFVYDNGIQPWGADNIIKLWGVHDLSAETCETTGYGCAAKVLIE